MVNRRAVLAVMAMAGLWPRYAVADTIVDLTWDDLLPLGEVPVPAPLLNLLDHDETAPMTAAQPPSGGVRAEWSGQTVRLSGFVVPLDFNGTDVTAFLLVPYVGACVHVPPPPANQLVLVSPDVPFVSDGLFAPVTVTGVIGVTEIATALADVGYTMTADQIAPFRG